MRLNELATELAGARQYAATMEKLAAALEDEITAHPLYSKWKDVQEELKVAQAQADVAKALFGVEALTEYNRSGNKKPHPAVEIKMMIEVLYDEKEALAYAREHIPNAVKLDAKKFEAAAKALELPFVTTEEYPKAYVSANWEG